MKKASDLTGLTFGRLTVKGPGDKDRFNNRKWECVCECGTERSIVRASLVKGLTKSCGCLLTDAGLKRRKPPKLPEPPAPKLPRVRKPHVDLVGQTFNRLTVTAFAGFSGAYAEWRCKCACGTRKVVRGSNLKNGAVKSCGCLARDTMAATRRVDLTGERRGSLDVIRFIERKGGDNLWLCRCDCSRTISATSIYLNDKSGAQSCGCHKAAMARQTGRDTNTTHGFGSNFERPKEYTAWGKARNINEIVAPEFDSFTTFLEMVGPKPSDEHRLVILDKPKGFIPGNVEWRHYPKKVSKALVAPAPVEAPPPAPNPRPALPWGRSA